MSVLRFAPIGLARGSCRGVAGVAAGAALILAAGWGGPTAAYADERPKTEDTASAQAVDSDADAAPEVATGEVIELSGAAPDRDAVHRDAARGLDEGGFVTIVHVDERDGEALSVADAVAETVGVQASRAGGMGSYSSISVRGAEAGHTTILVDGIPLSRLASVGVDLSRFDLGSVSEIELYRGVTPAGFGGATIGGAVNLRTRTGRPARGPALSASTGVGSFGSRHARARWLGDSDDGRRGYHLSLTYGGAEGDFGYFDDHGTSANRADDSHETRSNNHYDQVGLVARARGQRGKLDYHAGVRSGWKQQGVPGTASAQSLHSTLASMTHLVDVGAATPRLFGQAHTSGQASLYGVFEWQRYRDLDGEIGVGVQDRRYLSTSVGAVTHVSRALSLSHRLEAGVDARVDAYEDRDMAAGGGADADDTSASSRGVRTALAATLDHTWSPARGVQIRPAVRLDWLRTVPTLDRHRPSAERAPRRDDVVASPRLSARARIGAGLALKASLGRYMRAPTLLELYGDRGFTVGNPALRVERGTAGDLGLVLAPLAALTVGAGPGRVALDRVYLEAAIFGRQTRDTIAFVSAGGPAATAQNLGESRTYGAEGGVSARLAKTATVRANYTYLVARQRSPLLSYDDKPLPRRPRHQVYARIDLNPRLWEQRLGIWLDTSYVVSSYLDAAGLSPIPARTLIGAGVRASVFGGLSVAVEGRNLADARIEQVGLDPPPEPGLMEAPRAIADLAGYPLPGRSYYLTLLWQR